MADNIYQRGRTYWGRIYVNGREFRKSLRTSDEQEALARVKAWEEETKGSDPQASITWKAAVANWMQLVYGAKHDLDGLKPNVRKRYAMSLRPVSYLWQGRTLSQCGAKAIAEFVKARKAGMTWVDSEGGKHVLKPCTNSTLHNDLTAISSVFRAAMAAGLWHENPSANWDRGVVKVRRRFIIPPLPHEIETVIGYANRNMRRVIEFAANTGMRKQEIATMEWRDVRLSHGDLLLPRTKVSRPRAVKLCTPGGDATGTLTGTPRHITAQWVFWTLLGEPYADLTNSFKGVMARAIRCEAEEGRELRPFRFHDLRHAFAVRWLLNGGDLYALSKHLGHTSVKTTEDNYLCMISDYEALVAARKAAEPAQRPEHAGGFVRPAVLGNAAKSA